MITDGYWPSWPTFGRAEAHPPRFGALSPGSATMEERSADGVTPTSCPTPWALLERALLERRAIQAAYHGRIRLLSPHALGTKNGRAKVLAYQADDHAPDPTQQWR